MPSDKRDYTVERESRREDTRRKRQERVMCEYIKHAHPTAYEEAYKVYEKLNTMYPNKRDLRKTPYFINVMKGVEKKSFGMKPSRKNRQGQEFALRIPLMRTETRATTTSSIVVPSSVVAPSSPLPVVPLSPLVVPQPSPPLPELPSVPQPSPPLPIDAYQTLLKELQQDPQLHQILNNFPLQECNEEMDKLVAEDIGDIDGISPLEAELH